MHMQGQPESHLHVTTESFEQSGMQLAFVHALQSLWKFTKAPEPLMHNAAL